MKSRIILISIIAIILITQAAYAGTDTKPKLNRYDSGWVEIPPDSSIILNHKLGLRPLLVQAYVAYNLDFPEACPSYDWQGGGIVKIASVNAVQIILRNYGQAQVFVQVIAEP